MENRGKENGQHHFNYERRNKMKIEKILQNFIGKEFIV